MFEILYIRNIKQKVEKKARKARDEAERLEKERREKQESEMEKYFQDDFNRKMQEIEKNLDRERAKRTGLFIP